MKVYLLIKLSSTSGIRSSELTCAVAPQVYTVSKILCVGKGRAGHQLLFAKIAWMELPFKMSYSKSEKINM